MTTLAPPSPPFAPPLGPSFDHCAIAQQSVSLCILSWHVYAGAVLSFVVLLVCGLFIYFQRKCRAVSIGRKPSAEDSSVRSDVAPTSTPGRELTRQPTPAQLTRTATMPRCRSVERALDEGRQRTDDVLPDGWQEHADTDGNKYYFNLSTRTMSWTRPTGGAAAASVGAHGVAPPPQDSPILSAAPCGGRAVPIEAAAPMHLYDADASGVPPPLPEGWRAVAASGDGEPCYFEHAASHRTAWAPPPAE